MKKAFVKGILIVLAVVIAVNVSGCKSTEPETSSTTSPSPVQQSPDSPANSPSPSSSPSPTLTKPAMPEPVISDGDSDDEPYYHEYEGEFLGFFFQEYYYLDGDDSLLGLYFWDDGDVDLADPDYDSVRGVYDVDDGIITIYVNGDEYAELLILDCATLLDFDNGVIYALVGALDNELEIDDYYYLDGDEDAGNLWFWDDGEVDIEDSDGDVEVGTYEVYGVTIVIELDSSEVELYIINSYILESEHGDKFIRVP